MKLSEEKVLRDNIRYLIRYVKQKRLNEEQEMRKLVRKLIKYELIQEKAGAAIHGKLQRLGLCSPARRYWVPDLEICYEKKSTARVNLFLGVMELFSYFSGDHITQTCTAKKESSKLIDFEKLEQSIKTISLEELLDVYPKMLKGETSGRHIIDLNK